MKSKMALVSIVTSLALVGLATPARAQTGQDPVGNLIGGIAATMGIACNAVNVLGLPICHQ